METLTRCLYCLRLSQTRNGQCIFDDCLTLPKFVIEGKAQFLMGLRGYRLHSGTLWLITNDDPEDFSEVRIAEWTVSHLEAYRNLILHDWPTSSLLICPACGDGQAEEFGGVCHFCAREAVAWERAGEVR